MTEIDWTKYIGIPYEDAASSFDGCDCYGLVKLILETEFGFPCPDYGAECEGIPIKERGSLIESKSADTFISVKSREHLVSGDVLLFRIMGNPIHMGLYISKAKFLHTEKGIDSCLVRMSPIWQRRTIGLFRHKAEAWTA